MRLKALLIGDIRFQFKYGFYFLYLIFTILYVGMLYALPAAWRERAAVLMIFTDPAAMGLYFMGAIVLFEKGERVFGQHRHISCQANGICGVKTFIHCLDFRGGRAADRLWRQSRSKFALFSPRAYSSAPACSRLWGLWLRQTSRR